MSSKEREREKVLWKLMKHTIIGKKAETESQRPTERKKEKRCHEFMCMCVVTKYQQEISITILFMVIHTHIR